MAADALVQSLGMASQAWVSFDLQKKRSSLEKTAATAKEQKEQSLAARKQLADTTKQFKRSVKAMEQASGAIKESTTPESVGSAVKAMDGLAKECRQTIRSYQEEIDNLTRRCKGSEAAFLSVQQSLMDIPDPAAALGTAMEQLHTQQTQIGQLLKTVEEANREMSNLEQQSERYKQEAVAAKGAAPTGLGKEEREELFQLRREVAEYEVEFKSLKNQDITIRKLEAKIAELEDGAKEELAKELERAQQDLAETEGRRAAEALEREAAMERRVQTLELQLKAERAGREATQAHLLEADEGAGEREAAFEAQRKILVDDAELLRETLHEATRERDELRLRVAALEGDGRRTGQTPPPSGGLAMADMILERRAYEAEVSELSHTANSLREEAIREEKTAMQDNIAALEQERLSLRESLADVQARLAAAPSQSSVDRMKRELRVLKRLEYNADDPETDRDPEMTGDPVENEDVEEQNFESVLVSKLRRVESELVRERNEKVEISRECDSLQKRVAEAEKAQKEAEKLVISLEKDLDRAIAVPSSPMAHRKAASMAVVDEKSSATLQTILDPSSSPTTATESAGTGADGLPGVVGAAPMTPVKNTTSVSAAEKANDDHSVATIIMAQRDRLRARCEAMEAERDSFKRELQAQVQATESLKGDNTKLYEKVRYLQNYNRGGSGGGGGAFQSRGTSGSNKAGADRDLDLEALEQRYEASVDPFRQFSRTERQRKMKEMSPMERIVFIVAKTVLGSKEMRTALFFYVCIMHLLVFFSTYHGSQACDVSHAHEFLSNLPPDHHTALASAAQAARPPPVAGAAAAQP